MIEVSEDLIREAYTQPAKPPAILITIDYDGLAEPKRITDWPGDLGDGTFGLISDGLLFKHCPLRMTWSGAGREDGAKEARIEIAALPEVVEAVRAAPVSVQPTATVELVRIAAPDLVEKTLKATKVGSAEVADGMVIVILRPRDYSREYAVGPRYTIARTPGLH